MVPCIRIRPPRQKELLRKSRPQPPSQSLKKKLDAPSGVKADMDDDIPFGVRLRGACRDPHSPGPCAERGFHVFPCRPRDKRPATANGLKDATTDPDVIQAWWQQQPDSNIAIATGAASGIFVVDIDGLDAEAALRRLEVEHGALPATVEAITARGRHVYFKWPQ